MTIPSKRAIMLLSLSERTIARQIVQKYTRCDYTEDDSTPEIKARYESWWALQVELIGKVATILQCEAPYIKLATPFIEHNGYRDGRGWCVKAEETNKNS